MRGWLKILVGFVAVVILGASAALATHTFDDVPDGSYFDEATEWAKAEGLTVGCNSPGGGVPGTLFCPTNTVNRAQNVTFMYRHQTQVIDPLLDDIRADVAANAAAVVMAQSAAEAAQAAAADDADTLGGLSCEASQVAIDDGGWRCATPALVSELRSTGRHIDDDAYYWKSIAVGIDGKPIIAYYDELIDGLKVYVCADPLCADGDFRTLVDTADDVGWNPSIAIGRDGNPVIAHRNQTTAELEVYSCTSPDCTSGNNRQPGFSDTGYLPSIAIGSDGNPVVAHAGTGTFSSIELLACSNASCSVATNEQLYSADDVGSDSSLVIASSGNPIIAHYNGSMGSLSLEICEDLTCSAFSTIQAVGEPLGDDRVGFYISGAIGADGNPVFAHHNYTDRSLEFYACDDAACSSGANQVLVDVADMVGWYPSVAIGVDGNPVIAHHNSSEGVLEVYTCDDTTCTSGSNQRPAEMLYQSLGDGADPLGVYPSLAIAPDGNAVIAHSVGGGDGALRLDVVYSVESGIAFE